MSPLETAELILLEIARGARELPADDYQKCRAREALAEGIIAGLSASHGARYRRAGDAHFIRIANIGVSCTQGKLAMLQAWARKALALERAAA